MCFLNTSVMIMQHSICSIQLENLEEILKEEYPSNSICLASSIKNFFYNIHKTFRLSKPSSVVR